MGLYLYYPYCKSLVIVIIIIAFVYIRRRVRVSGYTLHDTLGKAKVSSCQCVSIVYMSRGDQPIRWVCWSIVQWLTKRAVEVLGHY